MSILITAINEKKYIKLNLLYPVQIESTTATKIEEYNKQWIIQVIQNNIHFKMILDNINISLTEDSSI